MVREVAVWTTTVHGRHPHRYVGHGDGSVQVGLIKYSKAIMVKPPHTRMACRGGVMCGSSTPCSSSRHAVGWTAGLTAIMVCLVQVSQLWKATMVAIKRVKWKDGQTFRNKIRRVGRRMRRRCRRARSGIKEALSTAFQTSGKKEGSAKIRIERRGFSAAAAPQTRRRRRWPGLVPGAACAGFMAVSQGGGHVARCVEGRCRAEGSRGVGEARPRGMRCASGERLRGAGEAGTCARKEAVLCQGGVRREEADQRKSGRHRRWTESRKPSRGSERQGIDGGERRRPGRTGGGYNGGPCRGSEDAWAVHRRGGHRVAVRRGCT